MKKLTLALVSLFSLSAYADNPNVTMAQIQSEINSLNAELNSPKASTNVPVVGTDAADPLATLSKVQMPVQVLKAKNQLNNPLVFGGEIETDLQYTQGNSIPLTNGTSYQNGSDVSLSKVYFMTMANINDETTALVNIDLVRPNYNVGVERAFLIFGNLNRSPFSLMVGANYLPFGTFSGNANWSNALTTNLFRINTTNQIMANYTNSWLTLNAGIYSNNNVGVNNDINYLFNGIAQTTWKNIGMSLGASYISDVRKANSSFGKAYAMGSPTSATQPLTGSKNGAFDVNGSIGPSYFTLLGEYVTTADGATEAGQSVGPMSVWMLGEQSKFKIDQYPTVFQISYSATKNMQSIPMIYNGDIPQNLYTAVGIQHQWLTSLDTEFWKNVWVGPELVTAKLYTGQHSYTGNLDCTAYF